MVGCIKVSFDLHECGDPCRRALSWPCRNRWDLAIVCLGREKDYEEHWPWALKDIEVGASACMCASPHDIRVMGPHGVIFDYTAPLGKTAQLTYSSYTV